MIVCKMINGVQIVKNKQSFLKTNIKISPHLAREQLSQLLVYLQLEPVLECHSTALSSLDSNMIKTFKSGVDGD